VNPTWDSNLIPGLNCGNVFLARMLPGSNIGDKPQVSTGEAFPAGLGAANQELKLN